MSSDRGSRPTAVDLFAGAGGLSLGAEQAGMDVLAAVEYDPVCAAVHRFNFPRTEVVCVDAAALSAQTVKDAAGKGWRAHGRDGEWRGTIDVVVGGPPCQGFSVIGKRAFDDPRNQLVFSFARLVGTLQPRYFVMENVPGIASVSAGEGTTAPRLLDLLVEEFAAFGYHVLEPEILNAYNFGVPQDRRRMILIGWRSGENRPAYPRAETRGRTRRGAEAPTLLGYDDGLPLCPSVWDAIRDLPNLDRFKASASSDEIPLSDEVLMFMEARASPYIQRLRALGTDDADLAHPRDWDRTTLTSSFATRHRGAIAKRFARTDPGHPESVSRFFRLHRNGVSPTLRAGTHYERGSFNAPRPIHPEHPRVISVREAARLHSFPDWFRFHWTKWHGFREVGNSLPPRMARAVGSQIVTALGAQPERPVAVIELADRGLLYLENVPAAAMFGADLTRIPRNALRRREVPVSRKA